MTLFSELGLDGDIIRALEAMGYKEAKPIQEKTIPLILAKKDLVALAETGSGKTAACCIPICQTIDHKKRVTQALVLVPTRELCLQYAGDAAKIGQHKGVSALAIYGGADASMQQAKLSHGAHLVVATPGRLIDFIYAREIDLSHVETIVLDEADQMLDIGFYDDIEFIMQCLVQKHTTLLFSATMPQEIEALAQKHMKDPQRIALIDTNATPKTIEHYFVFCPHAKTHERLAKLIEEFQPKQAIVFCDSRIACEKAEKFLKGKISGVDCIHGGMDQDLRTSITAKFRSGKLKILVATDVAGRGLDFSNVTHVFMIDLPRDLDAYIHRSGRTGRAGRQGTAVTILSKDRMKAFERLKQKLNTKIHLIDR